MTTAAASSKPRRPRGLHVEERIVLLPARAKLLCPWSQSASRDRPSESHELLLID